MTDWTSGYVADIAYTFGYYAELNPLRVKLAFTHAGLVSPDMGTACELGFGQGVSANIHAAATITTWHGTDFNPAQACFAQELAAVSGSGAELFDDAFADFSLREDLPEFDYIGLHGIWSWISDENRAQLVDFIRRKLKVGGVLYISYNTQPGWAAFSPMRDLLLEHKDVLGSKGTGIIENFNKAVSFAEKLLETNPTYAVANPFVKERLLELKSSNGRYLVHEYFNRDWLPMNFSDTAALLAAAKMDYACSANYLDHVDSINFTAEQQSFLQEIPDSLFRQTVRDFMVNQQFRRDYWVKGARPLNVLEQSETLRQQKVILVIPRSEVCLKVRGALGEAVMNEAVYKPILDALADHKPHTLGELEQALKDTGVALAHIVEATMILTSSGVLFAVQDEAITTKAKKLSDKLNLHLMNIARGSDDISNLASPVTGGGIFVSRFQQLFLLANSQGKKQTAEWAEYVWQVLLAQGQKIVKEGTTLETPEENLAELLAQAKAFAEHQWPIFKALQIV